MIKVLSWWVSGSCSAVLH